MGNCYEKIGAFFGVLYEVSYSIGSKLRAPDLWKLPYKSWKDLEAAVSLAS